MGEVIRDGRGEQPVTDSQRQPATGSMQPHYQHGTASFLSLATYLARDGVGRL
jgi:hypothetical protein